jgi:2-polyprenyl-6-methoxyphenol hydroxylase-like FAD-dependent oxidoreductase
MLMSIVAIVIGAGLGGCAAVIALHHHGHRVLCVLDKVREFGRLGDSLGLGENAFKLLAKWGCEVHDLSLLLVMKKRKIMLIRRRSTRSSGLAIRHLT